MSENKKSTPIPGQAKTVFRDKGTSKERDNDNAIRTVTIRQKSIIRVKQKITAARYEYQADGDGEWGEIQFDFLKNKGEIIYLAEWETSKTHVYAKKAMEIIFGSCGEKLPKKKMAAFPR